MAKNFEDTYKIPLGPVENAGTQIFNSPSKMWMSMVTERRAAREKIERESLQISCCETCRLNENDKMV